MSHLTKERVEYLQKIVKKEVVPYPKEAVTRLRNPRWKKQGKYWYLSRQDFGDWKRWMKYVDEINIHRPVKMTYWEPQQPRDLVVVMAEEVTVLDPIFHLY